MNHTEKAWFNNEIKHKKKAAGCVVCSSREYQTCKKVGKDATLFVSSIPKAQ